MDGNTKQGKIIPTNFGLKYNPPKLGIQYYFKENPKATFVHEVKLENAFDKRSDELLNELFTKHKKFVDPKVVSRNQLENLMDRLKSHVSIDSATREKPGQVLSENNNKQEGEKENINNNKTSAKREVASKPVEDDWGLDSDEGDNKDDDLMPSQNFDKDIFSGANKEEFKNSDKEFMLDDFDMGNEDQKYSDRVEKSSKHMDSNQEEDQDTHNMENNDNDDDDDSDAIDIDNEEELAARGLKKIQIEGEEEEFLMDAEGNIYNLNGDFIGTTNGDADGEGDDEDF